MTIHFRAHHSANVLRLHARRYLGAVLAALAAGCGGPDRLSAEERQQVGRSINMVVRYCFESIGAAPGVSPELGRAAESVDTLIRIYRDHPNAVFQAEPIAPRRTMRGWLRALQSTLVDRNCARDQAAKIDRALAEE